ncbi:hypothetical protein BLNAU_21744 [Blattamonas nauphoetae]|uniref:Uncharacterized protein n=1 Tax=Blattamonas nauphoetae TaxID=2049346 RepID=A0ABQ9WUZ6_9EUKA|nr:hypothetical protein BLNAU_21744 [Blattamonas nauphoetae]
MVSSANAMVSVSAFSIVLFEDIKRRCTCVARPRRAAEDGSVADEQWIVCVALAVSCGGERRRDGHRCHRVLSTPDCGVDPSLLPSLSQIGLKILMSHLVTEARRHARDNSEASTRSLLVCLLAGCSSNWSIALHPDCRLALSMFPTLTR